MLIDLTIRTLQGSYAIRSLHPSLTVEELKMLLYETVRDACVQIPKPENQNLVHNGSSLDEEKSLKDTGIQSGDSLVLLDIPTVTKEEYPEPSEMPDVDAITKAITEYAKQNGLEGRLNTKEEPPARRGQRAGSFGYDHLRSILSSLEFGIDRHGAPNEVSRISSEEPVDSVEVPQSVQVPEPNAAHVESLLGMGFSEELIRKALLLHRNHLEETLDWLLQHHEDPDAATPLTPQELARIYGRRPRRRGREPDPEMIARIQEMGFTEQNAISALRTFGNNIEIAVGFLLQNQGQGPGLHLAAVQEDSEPVDTVVRRRIHEVEDEQEDFDDPDVQMAEAETGDEPDSPEFPSAAMISDSRLGHAPEAETAQGIAPDSDSEILSPFSPDGGPHEPLEAVRADDAHAQVDSSHRDDSIDVETFEEADEILGVDFQEGELEGLDLEDVERLLGNASEGTQAFGSRARALAAMNAHSVGQIPDNYDVLVNDWRISALDEVMHNSDLVERLREALNMLGAQGSNQGEEAGPSGETSGTNQ